MRFAMVLGAHAAMVGLINRIIRKNRRLVAASYLTGTGIEIGAQQLPLPLRRSAKVTYVDCATPEELVAQYPELSGIPLTAPDVMDDGERLEKFADTSLDFVIANHFLEHCPNPFLALKNMFRVLKPDGLLCMAIPDKRFTFDCDRPSTTVEHVIRDFEEGAEWSRLEHYEQWVKLVSKVVVPEDSKRYIEHLLATDQRVHFHAWTQQDMLEMLGGFSKHVGVCFEIELMMQNGNEVIFLLRKT